MVLAIELSLCVIQAALLRRQRTKMGTNPVLKSLLNLFMGIYIPIALCELIEAAILMAYLCLDDQKDLEARLRQIFLTVRKAYQCLD